jgi:pre-rRNA-processing protein TSR4
MAPKDEDEWSDSDDEVDSEVETSVLLGVPDDAVDEADINDAAVSRIGGHPVRYILDCFWHVV